MPVLCPRCAQCNAAQRIPKFRPSQRRRRSAAQRYGCKESRHMQGTGRDAELHGQTARAGVRACFCYRSRPGELVAALAPAAALRSLRPRSLARFGRSARSPRALARLLPLTMNAFAIPSSKKVSHAALASGARLARCAPSLPRSAAVARSRRSCRSLAPRSPGRSLACLSARCPANAQRSKSR